MSTPSAATWKASGGVWETASPSGRKDASVYYALPCLGVVIFSQPYHSLFFLGKVIHLHLHVPFALLPWQLLNLTFDLWGGKWDLSAGNFRPRTTPHNVAKQLDLRKHPNIPQKSNSFLLKHQQLLPSQILLWRNAEAFLEETEAGSQLSSILSPFLPPSSSASAAPGILHGPAPAPGECAWPPPAGAASDLVPSSQSAASAAVQGFPVQCRRTSSLPIGEGRRGQPQCPLCFISFQKLFGFFKRKNK